MYSRHIFIVVLVVVVIIVDHFTMRDISKFISAKRDTIPYRIEGKIKSI